MKLLLLALSVMLLVAPAHAITSAEDRAGIEPALQDVAPQITASGAIVVDLDDGVELYGLNADTPYPPASTVKILTGLVARQIFEREEVIEIQESDFLDEEFSQAGFLPGDQVSVEDALHGLLIPSGADAALALARIGGERLAPGTDDPVGRFVQEMNAVAESLEMHDSSFGNPVGMDDPETYASARDLVRAAVAVLADPLLSRIVAMPYATIEVAGPNAREIEMQNSNAFVVQNSAIGVKTGTEDEAGQCLI
ncbi:MAG: D-alanyl-D-alanine carboxypeptidase family protein, partial [Chloroflexota bacterium]